MFWMRFRKPTRFGTDVAKAVDLWILAGVHTAMGRLEQAERTARTALALMEFCRFGWTFVVEFTLGGILMYRGQNEEAVTVLNRAVASSAPLYRGFPEGLLAWGMTAAEMDGAADARTSAMRFLPRPGTSRGVGTWNAVLSLTEAFCLSGHREEAGRLQAETEKIAAEWDCNHTGFPVRTAAGIAAACTGNWAVAEEHHCAAEARMQSVPYVTALPIARYWHADMLAERGRAGDIAAAKSLLDASITASVAIGLELYARLARRRLAQIA